jgi:hypothetical protein
LYFLGFSMIFYGFYKVQLKHNKGEESFCSKAPGTI